MKNSPSYAPPKHWNRRLRQLRQSGNDLDWGQQWTGAFIDPLRQADVRTVLDFGCGTGERRAATRPGRFCSDGA